MDQAVRLPLLEGLLPGGLRYGANYLVEFEPQSLWYETSLTLCAQALKMGIRTDYHIFTHTPEDTRVQLRQLGLDLERLESDDTFRIIDSYSVQTGKGPPQKVGRAPTIDWVDVKSMSMNDWTFSTSRALKSEIPEVDKRRLHIDDNTSILVQFNDEKSVAEHFRTHSVPFVRHLELAAIHAVAAGIFSDSFYRQFETFCDGIIDFRSQETGGLMSHSMRFRVARGAEHDSAWRQLELGPNAEVRLVGPKAEGAGQLMSRPARKTASLPKDRVAVLPFANISPDPADDYFADGMTEEMISSVSRTKGLKVIARTSVIKYKGTAKSVSEIGRELNVGSVLEGSVRKAGDKIRITVQLVETSNEETAWSQDYDRKLEDVFAIQTDIAQKVAGALTEHVFGIKASEAQVATRSTQAFVDYLRGRQFWNARNEEGLMKAIGFFEKALEADPQFAKAYTGLADSYATLALLEFMAPREAYPKAKEAVARALSLEPNLAEAHTSLGLTKFQYDWDWNGAEQEFRGAIAINPSYAPAHHFFADYLKAMGRFEEALAEIEKAQDLDPLSLAINTGVGHVLYLSRQYDRAIEQYKKAVELDPSFMATHVWFGRPYLEKGMYAEAIDELETAVRLSGESTLALAMLGHGLASAGRKDEALKILDKLRERSKTRYVPSYWVAVVYNGFRERAQVIAWMKKAFEEKSSWLVWSNVEPRFDWLRGDPEFAALMKAMDFP